jgi:hypothetical protein
MLGNIGRILLIRVDLPAPDGADMTKSDPLAMFFLFTSQAGFRSGSIPSVWHMAVAIFDEQCVELRIIS